MSQKWTKLGGSYPINARILSSNSLQTTVQELYRPLPGPLINFLSEKMCTTRWRLHRNWPVSWINSHPKHLKNVLLYYCNTEHTVLRISLNCCKTYEIFKCHRKIDLLCTQICWAKLTKGLRVRTHYFLWFCNAEKILGIQFLNWKSRW